MRHKIASSVIAILYIGLTAFFGGIFRFFFAAMFAYMFGVMIYNFIYLRRHRLYSFWSWLRPLFFFVSLMAIYFILPGGFLKWTFLIFSALMIYFSEIALRLISEQMVFLQTLFSYFGLSLGIFAFDFYLLPKNTLVLLFQFFITFLLARSSLEYVPQQAEKKSFYALLVSLSILEATWALLLLPLHFTALAIIVFNIFYSIWILSYYHLFNNLNSKKISFHIVFPLIIIIMALVTTPWK